MTTAVETAARERLGFYPSYLAAVEAYPEYATLAYAETERVLDASWAPTAARRVVSAAGDAVAGRLPTADRRPDGPREAVRWFGFVVGRLGLSISACRYALDGRATLRAHRRPLPDAGGSPALLAGAVEGGSPAVPSLELVHPDEASGRVAAIYDRVLADLDTPNVNNVFRALAVDPGFLAAVVDAVTALLADGDVRRRFERRLRGWYATALDDAGYVPSAHRRALREAGLDRAAVDDAAGRIRAFHENLPTLVVVVAVAARLLDDGASGENEA